MPKITEVSKWQRGRPTWHYDPTMQFYFRLAMCALHDAMQSRDGIPTDHALLARDWFARSDSIQPASTRREFVSFHECCHWLGLDTDTERIAILAMIDARADFDTDECWERLERLSESNPDDAEPLFEVPDMFRVVAVRDQGMLFGISQ